jgi:hypothetical protein
VKPILVSLGLFSVLFTGVPAMGAGTIIHASRPLRMSYTEPLPPKDFYVNLGAHDGLKLGDRLVVHRNVGVGDAFSDASAHLVSVSLADLQIVAVGETACIARVDTTVPASAALPSLQYAGPMVGDEVFTKTGLPLVVPIP